MNSQLVDKRIIWTIINKKAGLRQHVPTVLKILFPNAWWCNIEDHPYYRDALSMILIPTLARKFPGMVNAASTDIASGAVTLWPLIEVGENDIPGSPAWMNQFHQLLPSINPGNQEKIEILERKWPHIFWHSNAKPGEVFVDSVYADAVVPQLMEYKKRGLSTARCDLSVMLDNMYRPFFANIEEYAWIERDVIV